MRYRLTLEYDGGPFVGWQRQDNGPSVQSALEDAIEKLRSIRPGSVQSVVQETAVSMYEKFLKSKSES